MEDIIELVIHIMKGLIVGVVCSAPMGPVGILCLRRTIKKGRPYGIATGAGAALSDLFYALLTGYGLSLISGYTTHDNIFGIKLAVCIMLMVFGIYM